MPQFPLVPYTDGGRTAQAASGTNPAAMFVSLYGSFTQGVPPDLARLSIGTGASTITLSPATVFGVYIRNVSATASVQVTWTPTAGASAIVATLAPGAFIAFANPSAGAAVVTATPGISALTLQASAAATPVEFAAVG